MQRSVRVFPVTEGGCCSKNMCSLATVVSQLHTMTRRRYYSESFASDRSLVRNAIFIAHAYIEGRITIALQRFTLRPSYRRYIARAVCIIMYF